MFTPAEKALLRELKMSSTWAGITQKLREFHRPPAPYQPGKGNERQQELDWIYYSGVDRGASDLLKLIADE